MTQRRRGGGRPERRTIRPGIGRPVPGPVAHDRPDPAAHAHDHDHAHWHFWRLTHDGIDYARREIPTDTWYALDVFATTAAAVEAAAEDVVARYPDAKRLKSLADFIALAPTNTGSTFRYTRRELYVLWGLLGCDGQCRKTTDAHGKTLMDTLARMLDQSQQGGR